MIKDSALLNENELLGLNFISDQLTYYSDGKPPQKSVEAAAGLTPVRVMISGAEMLSEEDLVKRILNDRSQDPQFIEAKELLNSGPLSQGEKRKLLQDIGWRAIVRKTAVMLLGKDEESQELRSLGQSEQEIVIFYGDESRVSLLERVTGIEPHLLVKNLLWSIGDVVAKHKEGVSVPDSALTKAFSIEELVLWYEALTKDPLYERLFVSTVIITGKQIIQRWERGRDQRSRLVDASRHLYIRNAHGPCLVLRKKSSRANQLREVDALFLDMLTQCERRELFDQDPSAGDYIKEVRKSFEHIKAFGVFTQTDSADGIVEIESGWLKITSHQFAQGTMSFEKMAGSVAMNRIAISTRMLMSDHLDGASGNQWQDLKLREGLSALDDTDNRSLHFVPSSWNPIPNSGGVYTGFDPRTSAKALDLPANFYLDAWRSSVWQHGSAITGAFTGS